ncbi:hypothetical protein [Bacillus horti]|uniref:Uncharacterized protein n=1 Tax=Caldalkalibacillus horti TaxID=77523 RepID=A0ABT9W0I1_9BACI|nr:hypothetical protein [Bacillus horti]MDQ0166609.1 hypothetical protein [Bacillus horti]
MGHYLGFKKQDVWQLTIPQLNYYLRKCNEHIEFTIKVHSMSYMGLFGSASSSNTSSSAIGDSGSYNEATAEDMEWLSSIL